MRKVNELYKKLIAICLIAVFFSIHVIKLFHTHPLFDHQPLIEKISFHKGNGECPVCDYHFSKNCDLPGEFSSSHLSTLPENDFVYAVSSLINAAHNSATSRGPPAFFPA